MKFIVVTKNYKSNCFIDEHETLQDAFNTIENLITNENIQKEDIVLIEGEIKNFIIKSDIKIKLTPDI